MSRDTQYQTCEEKADEEFKANKERHECALTEGNSAQAFLELFAPGDSARNKEALDALLLCPAPPSNGLKTICVFDEETCEVTYVKTKCDDPDECPNKAWGIDYVALVKLASRNTLCGLDDVDCDKIEEADCPQSLVWNPEAEYEWPHGYETHPQVDEWDDALKAEIVCGNVPLPAVKGRWELVDTPATPVDKDGSPFKGTVTINPPPTIVDQEGNELVDTSDPCRWIIDQDFLKEFVLLDDCTGETLTNGEGGGATVKQFDAPVEAYPYEGCAPGDNIKKTPDGQAWVNPPPCRLRVRDNTSVSFVDTGFFEVTQGTPFVLELPELCITNTGKYDTELYIYPRFSFDANFTNPHATRWQMLESGQNVGGYREASDGEYGQLVQESRARWVDIAAGETKCFTYGMTVFEEEGGLVEIVSANITLNLILNSMMECDQ